MYYAQTYTEAHRITTENDRLDGYSRKGVTLTRDAAHLVFAALSRDMQELRGRGGDANNRAADELDILRRSMMESLR